MDKFCTHKHWGARKYEASISPLVYTSEQFSYALAYKVCLRAKISFRTPEPSSRDRLVTSVVMNSVKSEHITLAL